MKYELARKPFAYENPVKANPPEISEQVLETMICSIYIFKVVETTILNRAI